MMVILIDEVMAMDEYINAAHLIKNIDTAITKSMGRGNAKSTENVMMRTTLGVLKQMVQDEVQNSEVRPIVHSHWVFKYGNYICANCKNRSYDKEEIHWNHTGIDNVPWCPHCGALMNEPDED